MAILHIQKENSYSIIDNVVINKNYKTIFFELLIYEEESKKVELNKKQYTINASMPCKEIFSLYKSNDEIEDTFGKIKNKYLEDLQESNTEISSLPFLNQDIPIIINNMGVYGAYNLKFVYDKNENTLKFYYTEERSNRYYYYRYEDKYFKYTDDMNNLFIDTNKGINSEHFFDNNVISYFKEQKNIIEVCYKLLKIIDADLLLYTVDV
jgi:hypothetical protein